MVFPDARTQTTLTGAHTNQPQRWNARDSDDSNPHTGTLDGHAENLGQTPKIHPTSLGARCTPPPSCVAVASTGCGARSRWRRLEPDMGRGAADLNMEPENTRAHAEVNTQHRRLRPLLGTSHFCPSLFCVFFFPSRV